jgi:phage gp36-like protein
MASYATPQQMIDEFSEREMLAIADPDDAGEVDLTRVQNALDSASEQIDFSVGQRCALPLVITSPSVASFLKRLCLDIARYRLTGSGGVTVTDEVKDRYKEADEKLSKIAAGKIVVCELNADQGGLAPGDLSAGEAESESSTRVFTASSLSDFVGNMK